MSNEAEGRGTEGAGRRAHVQTASHPSPAHDLVTCALFSPLATHLALASVDHHIRILHPGPTPPAWDHAPREWKAHDGPVLALAWAHPSFGPLLASGGVDGAVHLWREDEPPSHPHSRAGGAPQAWSLAASLLDARGTLRALAFAPPECGLKLAAVSSDNHLRVWECLDPLALREWTLRDDIDLAALPLAPSSGAPGVHPQADRPSANLGTGDGFGLGGGGGGGGAAGGTAAGGGATPGSSAGSGTPFPTVSSVSSATGSTHHSGGGGGARAGGTVESDGAWAVSWCDEAWWGERIAVSSGSNGLVRLFHFPSPPTAPWSNFLNLLPSRPYLTSSSSTRPSSSEDDPHSHPHGTAGTHTPPTSSLAWAPPSGRSFLLLAAGARDGRARVWKVFPPALGAPPPSQGERGDAEGEGEGDEGEWAARLEVELDPSSSSGGAGAGAGSTGGGNSVGGVGALAATRVAWNVTGTVLSTSGGDDARVRLWKPTYTGQWRQLAVLGTEDTPGAGAGP